MAEIGRCRDRRPAYGGRRQPGGGGGRG